MNSDHIFGSVCLSSLLVLPLSGFSLKSAAYVCLVQSLVLCGTHYRSSKDTAPKPSVSDEFEMV